MASPNEKTSTNWSGIEDSTDLLLALLYAPGDSSEVGEPIEGRTRIQKLMFLLQHMEDDEELMDKARDIDFKAYKMGPYSGSLTDNIEELEAANIIRSERLKYWIQDDDDPVSREPEIDSSTTEEKVESEKYSLTDIGQKIADDIWRSLDDHNKEYLKEFKSFFNSLSLRQLLIYTYEKFPEYTRESTIKDDLGL